MTEQMRTLAEILDDIAKEALASGDQRILELCEEADEWYEYAVPGGEDGEG